MRCRLHLLRVVGGCLALAACSEPATLPDAAGTPPDAAGATSDAAATSPDSNGLAPDAGPTGEPDAGPTGADAGGADTGPDVVGLTIAASREVVRIPAADAPASDSQTTLSATCSAAVSAYQWQVRSSATGAVVFTSASPSPTFACPAGGRGEYDVWLDATVAGRSLQVAERRLVACTLPRTDAGRTVHRVDLAAESYLREGKVGGAKVNPGDLVRVSGAIAKSFVLLNFEGTAEAPIHFVNDGLVTNTDTAKLLEVVNCRHLVIDGLGSDAHAHGFVFANRTGSGQQAVFIRNYTSGATNPSLGVTDIEVFGVHVAANAGTGLEVNTKGSAEFNRANWTFDHLRIHHVLVEDVSLEGFYLGYTRDWLTTAETEPAYQITDAKVFRNVIRRTGWDGLQTANFAGGLEVHDNHVSAAGLADAAGQSSAYQHNAGTAGAFVYDNFFQGGSGANLQVGCTGGDLYFFNNVLERAPDVGGSLVYLIAGRSPGVDYYFFGNTFRTRGATGIRANYTAAPDCGDGSPVRFDSLRAVNNLWVFPDGQVDGKDPAVYGVAAAGAPSPTVVAAPNLTRRESELADLCLADEAAFDYRPTCASSPALSGTGASLPTVGSLTAGGLPLGAFTDKAGRVLADPRNYGAFQGAEPAGP